MISLYNLPNGTKIKLWIDNLPDAIIDGSFIKKETHHHSCEKWARKKIAVELSLQKHNSSYGLLGLEYISASEQDAIEIVVHYSDKDENLFKDTIAFNKNTVYSSMPEEYADAILRKAEVFIRNNPNLPAGKLIFNTGAHCKVGSSRVLFNIITDILLNILMLNQDEYEDREIEEILDRLLVF